MQTLVFCKIYKRNGFPQTLSSISELSQEEKPAFLSGVFLSIYMYSRLDTAAAVAAKLLQSCLTLCNPIDGSPPGSSIHGVLQARTLEWVAISFSNAWKWKVKVKSLSRVWLFATPWTAAYQAPLSMGFSRQEYWSEVPLPSPMSGDQMRYWMWIYFLDAVCFTQPRLRCFEYEEGYIVKIRVFTDTIFFQV